EERRRMHLDIVGARTFEREFVAAVTLRRRDWTRALGHLAGLIAGERTDVVRHIAAELLDQGHVAVGRDPLGFEVRYGKLQMHRAALNLPGRMRLAAGVRGGREREARPQRQNQHQEGMNETRQAAHGLPVPAGLAASALFSAWDFS